MRYLLQGLRLVAANQLQSTNYRVHLFTRTASRSWMAMEGPATNPERGENLKAGKRPRNFAAHVSLKDLSIQHQRKSSTHWSVRI